MGFKEMDKDGDGFVETKDLPMIMLMFGEKLTDPEKIAKMNADFDPDNTERFTLQTFVDKIGNYIENYGTEDEVIEAFRVFDKQKTGSIPINQFRDIMKHYGQVEDEKLDEMLMDMFGWRKLQIVDPNAPVEYLNFAKMMFE